MLTLGLPGRPDQSLSPEEVSSHIIKHLVREAKRGLPSSNEEIHEAVITIPAYFTPAQRRATAEAAKLAGLKNVVLLQGGHAQQDNFALVLKLSHLTNKWDRTDSCCHGLWIRATDRLGHSPRV